MPLKLYDTLSRENREVFPMDGETVRFYGCGPTVYGPAHVGNFRTFVMQDVFRRVLETAGQKTYHARNLTDVDDKTIRQSQEEGVPLGEFTTRWTERFHQDCKALNLLAPHVEPSAVVHIPEQIALIERLIEGGKAYRAKDGSVYFKVNAFRIWSAFSIGRSRNYHIRQIAKVRTNTIAIPPPTLLSGKLVGRKTEKTFGNLLGARADPVGISNVVR